MLQHAKNAYGQVRSQPERLWTSVTTVLICAALLAMLFDKSLAGHSSPMRNASKLLAVADLFNKHCKSFGEVDSIVLRNELENVGIMSVDPGNGTEVAELRSEYVSRYRKAIRKEGVSSFCRQALEAFADKDPRILVRLK